MPDVIQKYVTDSTGIITLSVGTDLNSKISGSSNLIATVIDNFSASANWSLFAFEVNLGSITTSAGAGFGLYIMGSLDGTLFPDPILSGAMSGVNNVGITVGTGAKRGTAIIPVPPLNVQLLFVNNLGVTTAASGHSIRYLRIADRSLA